ncbi:type I-E CRISPR-associated protein Cas6/Cse3/CasE [Nocardia cyriacigeorgica]|uniref:type I-E CRISPR-associated protein Cas6/Cse3/CasE n=1 Tax=Nocardia cyriacigeorgica TaxID=135487 RepID=UPI001E653803|nr:type I-E CRISPR-associated protein Cas6/Cse3/CasE [Nocardia cyriacigeorgica]
MQINARRQGARVLLSSPQAMHAAVCAGFADARATSEGRVLWRVDTYAAHRVFLYVASPDKPDFTHIVEQAGWPTSETWDTRSYDGLLDGLRAGQRWQFRLTANPVHAGRHSKWDDTKPVGHVTVAQQEQWFLTRTDGWGFRVAPRSAPNALDGELELRISDRGVRRFKRGDTRVTITTATYEGIIEITDPNALRRTLAHGVGRAKSYGCGLMTLAHPGPPSS